MQVRTLVRGGEGRLPSYERDTIGGSNTPDIVK